ncbi:MAG: hypothetical protein WA389_14500, partial [Terriglobales bacterium]
YVLFRKLSVRMLGIVNVDELRKAQSASHASRAAADNDNVSGHFGVLDVRERFAEDQHLALSLWQLA